MAEKLQACQKPLGLKCCPFCGCQMKLFTYDVSGCLMNGDYVPPYSAFEISCSSSDCILSLSSFCFDNFFVSEKELNKFFKKFNSRVFDEKLYDISIEFDFS